jgi:hypothetical protein
MQVQLNEILKVMVKVVEQTRYQVMDDEEGEVEVMCWEGSVLGREVFLWVDPTTVSQNWSRCWSPFENICPSQVQSGIW